MTAEGGTDEKGVFRIEDVIDVLLKDPKIIREIEEFNRKLGNISISEMMNPFTI